MTTNTDNAELTPTSPRNTTPNTQRIKYLERLKSTQGQAFKSSTHLCITISWGAACSERHLCSLGRVGASC